MKNEFDLSWFDLSKYDAVKDFDGYEWYSHLRLRQTLKILQDRDYFIPNLAEKIIREIKKQPLSNRSSSIGEWLAVTDATYRDFIWANNNNPNSKDLYNLLGLLLRNEDTGEMRESYDISPHQDMVIESGAFSSGLGQVISSARPVLSVDLNASDEQLTNDFNRWLKEKRMQMGKTPRHKMFTSDDFDKWNSYKILPYLDLTIIASFSDKKLPWQLIGNLLFPDEIEIALNDKIRRTVKPLADSLLEDENLMVLRC